MRRFNATFRQLFQRRPSALRRKPVLALREWTMQYIALRAAREPDAFPAVAGSGRAPRNSASAPSGGGPGARMPMTELRRAFSDEFDTPIGRFTVVIHEGGGLHAAGWLDGRDRLGELRGAWQLVPRADPFGIVSAFRAYFEGELHALDALTLAAEGTEFQLEVWDALRKIPSGKTRSYLQLAQAIGRPKAVRAVGLANGANPLPVVVPCHRVIGADGSLTGYGGGLHRKRWLLAHERRRVEGELDLGGG